MRYTDGSEAEKPAGARRGRSKAERRENAKALVRNLSWLDGWPVFAGEGVVWVHEQVPWEPSPWTAGQTLEGLVADLAKRSLDAIEVVHEDLSPARISAAVADLQKLERYPVALGYLVEDPAAWKAHKHWQLEWAKSLQRVRLPDHAECCRQVFSGGRGALVRVVGALVVEAGCVNSPEPRPTEVLLKVGPAAVEAVWAFVIDPKTSAAGRGLALCLLKRLDPTGWRSRLKGSKLAGDGLLQVLAGCTLPSGSPAGWSLAVQAATLGANTKTVQRLLQQGQRCAFLPVSEAAAGPQLFRTGDVDSVLGLLRALGDHESSLKEGVVGRGLDPGETKHLTRMLRHLFVRGGVEAVGGVAVVLTLLDQAEALSCLEEIASLAVANPRTASHLVEILAALAGYLHEERNSESIRRFKKCLTQLLLDTSDADDQTNLIEAIKTYLVAAGEHFSGDGEVAERFARRLEFNCKYWRPLFSFPLAHIRALQIVTAHKFFDPPPSYQGSALSDIAALIQELGRESGPFLDVFLDRFAGAPVVFKGDITYLPLLANLSGRKVEIFRNLLPPFCQDQPRGTPGAERVAEECVSGSRKLLNYPEVRTYLTEHLQEHPAETLALLHWLGLAVRFNDPHLDYHLSRFVPATPVEVPEDLQYLVAVEPTSRGLLTEWAHYSDLMGKTPTLSKGMEKKLQSAQRMAEELDHLRNLSPERVTPPIILRMANLQEYLAEGAAFFQAEQEKILATVRRKVAGLRFEVLQKLVGDFYLEYLRRIAGKRAEGVRMTTDLVNAVQLYFEVEKNRQLLRSLLVHHLLPGESRWLRKLPKNARFLERLTQHGVDAEVWLASHDRTFAFTHGKRQQIRLYLETDPIRILQMGNYFDTCLRVGSSNAFSTIANAVDLNKRVVYAEDEQGVVIGRKLVALNAQFELVGFRTYTSLEDEVANSALRGCFVVFLLTFAQSCRVRLGERGEVPRLVAKDWYNDGIESWYWHVDSRVLGVIEQFDEITIGLLAAAMNSKNMEMRQAAFKAWGRVADEGSINVLMEFLGDSRVDMRQRAVEVMGRIGDARAVEPIIAALGDPSEGVRRGAAEALGRIGDIGAVEPLIAVLGDPSEEVRWGAAEALGRIGDIGAVVPLLTLLGDLSDEVCRAAVEALVKVGYVRTGEPLLGAMGEERRHVLEKSAEALGRIGDARAIESLANLLHDRDRGVRNAAANALRSMAGHRGVKPLEALLLRCEDSETRWSAARALGRFRDARVVEALAMALRDPVWGVVDAAFEALLSIRDIAIEALRVMLEARNPQVRAAAAKAFGYLWLYDQGVVELLIPMLADPDDDVRREVAAALGSIGDVRAVEPLVMALRDPDRTVRRKVVAALGSIRDIRGVEPLIAMLGDPDDDMRREVAAALGSIGDARAVGPLLTVLQDHVGSVREAVASALGRMGGGRAVEPLLTVLGALGEHMCLGAIEVPGGVQRCVETLLSTLDNGGLEALRGDARAVAPLTSLLDDPDDNVRQAAAVALGWIGDVRAAEPLVTAIGDPNSAVRQAAAVALGRIGDARAVEPLTSLLEYPDDKVRQEAVEALDLIGNVRLVEPLIMMLGDQGLFVRRAIATALGRAGDARLVETLVPLLGDPDDNVRQAVAETLGRIGDARAVEPLITALGDPNDHVRHAAAVALGRIGDVRAVEPLVTLGDSDERSHWETIEALGWIGGIREMEPIVAEFHAQARFVRQVASEVVDGIPIFRTLWFIHTVETALSEYACSRAAQVLGELGDTRTVGALVTMLGNGEGEYERLEAAEALGKIGDIRAVEPLIAALKDESEVVRDAVVSALEKLGHEA